MDIKLSDKFSLESNDKNFIIMETKISKEGKARKVNVGNYFTFNQMCEGIMEKSLKQSEATTFEELRQDVKIIKGIIQNVKESLA